MLLHHVINEIKTLQAARNHRAAQEIYNLLNNNRVHLTTKMDEQTLRLLIKDFEQLVEAHPGSLNTESWKREFDRAANLLEFYLNKIT
jgi:hypothetical protein